MAKLGRSQPKSDGVVQRRLETAKIKSKSKWSRSVRKTNGIIPRLALCSRDIPKNTLCQKIILLLHWPRRITASLSAELFGNIWLCNDTDFFSKSKNWKKESQMRKWKKGWNITVAFRTSLYLLQFPRPKFIKSTIINILRKELYQEGTDRLSYFVYKIFPLRPPKTL